MGYNGKAKTYDNVCEAMKVLADKKDVVTAYVALGDCKVLFSKDSKGSSTHGEEFADE